MWTGDILVVGSECRVIDLVSPPIECLFAIVLARLGVRFRIVMGAALETQNKHV